VGQGIEEHGAHAGHQRGEGRVVVQAHPQEDLLCEAANQALEIGPVAVGDTEASTRSSWSVSARATRQNAARACTSGPRCGGRAQGASSTPTSRGRVSGPET
jgi:hypothetical protein